MPCAVCDYINAGMGMSQQLYMNNKFELNFYAPQIGTETWIVVAEWVCVCTAVPVDTEAI